MRADQLRERVRESNRQAADAWDRWTPHRRHVTDVLAEAGGGRLCVLGAGQLNDISLDDLRKHYDAFTLVDLDADTVRHAVERRAGAAACTIAAPIDLTGVIEDLPRTAAGELPLDALLAALATHRCGVTGEPFDVTASLGVLTQLLQTVVDAGIESTDMIRAALAVRDKHLRDLVQLTRPGGACVLVTDVVSTISAPSLCDAPIDELEEQMARHVADRNFFTGANPYRIAALLEEDARFRDAVATVRLVGPWLWAVTKDRHHLTCAIVAQTRTARKP